MKHFSKRLALTCALLFTAMLCMGIVYIDSVSHYWRFSGGFVSLTVSNNVIMTVDTNTLRVGFNTNNTARSFVVQGRSPANTATGNGTSAGVTGAIVVVGGNGGGTLATTTATGGAGGFTTVIAGQGGGALLATTNQTGGTGGTALFQGGTGGGESGVATNATTGGQGGAATFSGGNGGTPTTDSTNTVGGRGGQGTFSSGGGGSPIAGMFRKGGAGGAFNMNAGPGGAGMNTNGGDGGAMLIRGGNAGASVGGDAGAPGTVDIVGGSGDAGATNSNGGNVYIKGGHNSGGGASIPGVLVLNVDSTGLAGSGVQIGPVVASSASVTNWLTGTATLDFPSVAAGTVADLPITVANAADGDVVALAVPIASVTNCVWMAWASNGVVYVRAANSQLVTAQDPNSGVFRVSVTKFR